MTALLSGEISEHVLGDYSTEDANRLLLIGGRKGVPQASYQEIVWRWRARGGLAGLGGVAW